MKTRKDKLYFTEEQIAEAKRRAARKWYTKNKERALEISRNYRSNRPAYMLFKEAQRRASKSALEFSIKEIDIEIPEKCPYLGVALTYTLGKGRQEFNPSLDRIDNSKGYTRENIQVISNLANKMKNNATKEQLLAFAKGVIRLHAC